MLSTGNDEKTHIEKVADLDCGHNMIDIITGVSVFFRLVEESGRLFTWGDRRNHPFGVKLSSFPFSRTHSEESVMNEEGLSSTDLLQATEVKTTNQAGRVYKWERSGDGM